MSVFNGHAHIYGVSSSGITVTVGGFAKAWIDSLPIAHRAKLDEHVGCNGLTGAFVWTNQYFEISISFRPSSTSTQASADLDALFVLKGATVTLSGFKPVKHSGTDILNGDWINVGDATLTLNKDEPATIDLTIRRYLDTAQQTTLKTAIPAEEA